MIELLVVIAIIALLISLLLPALGKARDQAKAVVCLTRLKGLGWATRLYAEDNNRAFVTHDWALGENEIYERYWFYRIAPYIEDLEYASPQDGAALGHFLRCPSGKAVQEWGQNGIFRWNAIDIVLRDWNRGDLASNGQVKPYTIDEMKGPAGFEIGFDFWLGEERLNFNYGSRINEISWDRIINNSEAYISNRGIEETYPRTQVFRHNDSIQILYGDAHVARVRKMNMRGSPTDPWPIYLFR